MRTFNRLIISLAVVLCIVNALLAWYGQEDIKVYFIADTLAYLIVSLLYTFLNPRARNALAVVGFVFFSGLMVIVALKVLEVLAGTG